jgi:hypothetical protein
VFALNPALQLPLVAVRNVRACRFCTAMTQVGIARLGSGATRQKLALERGANPKLSRRTCTWEYEPQSRRGKSAGVAKRPRELIISPETPHVTIRNFCIACTARGSGERDWRLASSPTRPKSLYDSHFFRLLYGERSAFLRLTSHSHPSLRCPQAY